MRLIGQKYKMKISNTRLTYLQNWRDSYMRKGSTYIVNDDGYYLGENSAVRVSTKSGTNNYTIMIKHLINPNFFEKLGGWKNKFF